LRSTLRSIDLRLLGSGFGSVSLEGVFGAIPTFLALAAEGIHRVSVERIQLADVEEAWSRKKSGKRIVFTP
jgi:NADPH2:quinone reductase